MWSIDEAVYRDKAYGGWLGKNIGGTLGGPFEGATKLLDLTFYKELPQGEPLPNDDLDLQLVWLHALEKHGPRLTALQLGQEWVEHVFFPFDEYGYALTNLRRGVVPPVAGWFGNPFADCMGSPIRSEIWAMIAPGLPELAAYYAWHDAVVDHAGGEGVWGEVLFAAIESAAFIEDDAQTLIEKGLSLIPAETRTAQVVRHLLELHAAGVPWQDARQVILEHHGRPNFTDGPQNIAFTLLGWLYGESFEDALLKAVNCGYDTDCTAATLGSILGIVHGARRIPKKWSEPIGDAVVLSRAIVGIDAPADLNELTERTLAVARETLSAWRLPVQIGGEGKPLRLDDYPRVDGAFAQVVDLKPTAITFPVPGGSIARPDLQVTVDYGQVGPAIGRSDRRVLDVVLSNNSTAAWEGTIRLNVPDSWIGPDEFDCTIEPGASLRWNPEVMSGPDVEPCYTVHLEMLRRFDGGRRWSTERYPIALVPQWEWEVVGPDGVSTKVASPTTEVPFGQGNGAYASGWWRARTTLYSPGEHTLNLIVATLRPMRTSLNKEKVLEVDKPRIFMPAYHRAAEGTRVPVTLKPGENELEIEVYFDDSVEPVMVVLVSPTRGLHHWELDILPQG